MTETLKVFDIERFAVHDGPGIRTVVFLKGCPLHCPWCANPESQCAGSELLYREKRCARCGLCEAACPHGAIAMQRGVPVRDRCRLCGACARGCPAGALRMAGAEMTIGEILGVLLRDRAYYERSGGGVTVSGGEPFVQHGGLVALLRACKGEGLHTAVETCGEADPEQFAAVGALVDRFLFDVKHTDVEKLRRVCGASAATVLRCLDAAVACGADRVSVRVPVIPGFNDREEDILSIFRLARERGVCDVHLLPYHNLGADKYAALGREDPMPPTPAMHKEALLPLCQMGEAMGLRVQAGG